MRTTFAERELARQAKNQSVIARWLRNQEIPLTTPKRTAYGGFKAGAPQPVSTQTNLVEPRYNLIPSPKSYLTLRRLLATTTARLGVWRAGTRPLTKVFLDFIADHAIAKEAVYNDFAKEKVEKLNLLEVFSKVKSKEEFLLRPDLGRELTPESEEVIRQKCAKNPDVQIIISDGLSGDAVTANVEELLPKLISHLQSKGYSIGTPLYCRYARVIFQDRVGEIVKAKTNVILIGERPGLGTGDGLSAYLIYEPNPTSTHANRNCISNIHPRGLVVDEAVKAIEFTITSMMNQKTSGVNLDLT